MQQSDRPRVALITGGSAGLGFVIAREMLAGGFHVIIVGRSAERLARSMESLAKSGEGIESRICDVGDAADVAHLFEDLRQTVGRLDVLVNCVGQSDRGLVEKLSAQRLDSLLRQNVTTALLCCQHAIPLMESGGGTIVNIGSLASKVAARYIGGYAIAKHALAGLTQQLRLELRPRGIHVALVNPGPIQRADAGRRYDVSSDPDLPDQAAAPGGGARLKGLPPERVADAVMRCVEGRVPDVVLPKYLRILIAIGHAFPRLGDWLLLKFTSSTDSS